ncbi:hypothetical protein QVD99_000514 [Batrachochytrium dendrobatidis]|nr:hypothetical protein O5D80_008093 [Batrachochytrium dendrobatidis]KAK5673041.1 hypothetical protein QVD99_000514 [Batrachochytrium dendrobatidis]
MWKSTATITNKSNTVENAVSIAQNNEDDWTSDPDFVNEISEKDQRWGKQKTIEDKSQNAQKDMADLRATVVAHHETKIKSQWENQNGASVKQSYGASVAK